MGNGKWSKCRFRGKGQSCAKAHVIRGIWVPPPNSLPHLAPCMHEPLLRPVYRNHTKGLAFIPASAQSIAGDLAKRSSLGFTIVL